jgi:serine/threonine-protein kinase
MNAGASDEGEPAEPRAASPAELTRVDAPFEPPPLVEGVVAVEPGATLGAYTLERELGRGAMGIVFAAKKNGDDRTVAVKILRDPSRAKLVQRFVRETNALGRLEHPNIVRLHDWAQEGELPYYVMDYVDGSSFDVLLETKALPLRQRVKIVSDVARAVAHAHSKGVIHRDLKPANVLVSKEGVPLVSDFGLARVLDEERLTRTGAAIGTPNYMSPEQLRGGTIDARTDIYSLGVMLYEVLEERLPFAAEEIQALYSEVATKRPPRPRADRDLADTIMRALEKDPVNRHQTALELAREIEAWLARPPAGATGSGLLRPVIREQHSSTPVVLGVAAGVAILGLTIYLAVRSHAPAAPKRRPVRPPPAAVLPPAEMQDPARPSSATPPPADSGEAPGDSGDGWVSVAPTDEGFSFSMPGRAQAKALTLDVNESRFGDAPRIARFQGVDYALTRTGAAEVFSFDYFDLSDSFVSSRAPQTIFDSQLTDVFKACQAQPVVGTPTTVGGYPARDVATKSADGRAVKARLVLVRNRLYVAVALVPIDSARADGDRFLDSLVCEAR